MKAMRELDEFGGGLAGMDTGRDMYGNSWTINTGVHPLVWKLTMKDGRTATGTGTNNFDCWAAISDQIAKGTPVVSTVKYTVTAPVQTTPISAAPITPVAVVPSKPMLNWWDQLIADIKKTLGMK